MDQTGSLDDVEKLNQQVRSLGRQFVSIPQAREEVARRLHRGGVSTQEVGAKKC